MRLWTLPDPGVGGVSLMDMQLLAVGVGFYTPGDSPPVYPPPPSTGYGMGGGGFTIFPAEKSRDRAAIERSDQDFMELLAIILPIIMEE